MITISLNCSLGIHPAVIAALASRESHAGRLLVSTGGWGDNHHAYGTLQVINNFKEKSYGKEV